MSVAMVEHPLTLTPNKEVSGMTIYQNTKKKDNYRKLWEQYHGPIPKDLDGRTFDIHHIDGNRNNNSIENLIAVSIQEHYDIHESQGDWGACKLIAIRMEMSPELISELARKAMIEDGGSELHRKRQLKMVIDGTHPFLGPETNNKKVIDRTHPWLASNGGSERSRQHCLTMLAEGIHPFMGDGSFQREVHKKRVDDGSHHLLGNVSCFDRMGNAIQVSKDVYHRQKEVTKDMTQWEYAMVNSSEGKKRKLGLCPSS